MTGNTRTNQDLLSILENSLNWAEKRNYKGYSKFDALNSPLLKTISGNSFYLKAGFIYVLSRFPINIRPLLFVRKKQNPKGLALFIRTYCNLYRITNNDEYLRKAKYLVERLMMVSQKDKFHGDCWGYEHPWQNKSFYAPAYFPNTVVTVNVGEALLDLYEITGKKEYLQTAISITNFIEKDLTRIIDDENFRCSSYIPGSNWKVINVNALIGGFYSRLYKLTKNNDYKAISKRYISWVISTQTEYDAWYYAVPAESSPITHDNYHTGFNLDAIFDYMENTKDKSFETSYLEGLDFYRTKLFTKEFAPKWMHDKNFPYDIHGVAQGIITFTKAGKYDTNNLVSAKNIASLGIRHLYNKTNRFFYQKGKYLTKQFTLMRWSQAWMCYALSMYILEKQIR